MPDCPLAAPGVTAPGMRLTIPLLLLGAAPVAGLLSLSGAASRTGQPPAPPAVAVFPFGMMPAVRNPMAAVPMQVQLYNSGAAPVRLEEFVVRTAAGLELVRMPLAGERLAGDGGQVADLHLKLELVNPDLSHRHGNRVFVPLEERPELQRETEASLWREIESDVAALRASGAGQIRNLRFELDLRRVFQPGAQPGDEAALDLRLRYLTADGSAAETSVDYPIALLPQFLPPPPGARGGGAWVKGDLHVHNCRDQAIGGCPDCAAESANVSGSYSNADLKVQFQALGFDYFSTSTHSYCINSDAEFDATRNESLSLDEPGFQVLCGTEISGRETGRQTGDDDADLLCELGFGEPIHHLGAHGIASRRPGGDDGVMDFCDAPIRGVEENAKAVAREGGFTVANHPRDDFFAFNSTYDLHGVERGQVYGVEIWNGSTNRVAAQPYHVAWWLDRLREGLILYAYSGSDTHDAAYHFGATHAFVEGPLSDASLLTALKSGRTFVSNGPFLDLELNDAAGRQAFTGDVVLVPASQVPPGYSFTATVHYNLGAFSGRIRLFRGSVGGGSEVLLQEWNKSGAGAQSVSTPVITSADTWYRAELVNSDGSQSAYTSPVFLRLR